MNKSSSVSTFIKGAAAGMAVGAAIATAGKMYMDNHHNISKGSSKAVKAIGDFVDGVQTMFH